MPERITTVVTPAASYNLTDLATVKDDLAITGTTNDNFFNRAITQSSVAIATYCNRVFPVEKITDTFFLRDSDSNFNISGAVSPLQLARWPVVAVLSVTADDIELTEGVDFTVDTESGQVHRLSQNGDALTAWYRAPVAITYLGGYGLRFSEAKTVPGTGPYTVQAAATTATDFSGAISVTLADGTVLDKVSASPAAGEYIVNSTGLFTFNAAQASASITLLYARASIPPDLTAAAIRLITMRYRGKDRDPMQISRAQPGIGEDRWWVGVSSGHALPPEIEGLIDPYRVPSFG